MGAYIDILPLDDVPNGSHAKEISQTAERINRQMLASAALDECAGPDIPECKEQFCYSAGGVAGMYSFFADRYEKFCRQYTDMHYYAIPVIKGERGYRVFEKEWFSDSTQMEFEGLTVPAPAGWKETLIASFPEGIYEPDEKDRKARHTQKCVVDMKRSYRDYVCRYTDMLHCIEGKKVYIFGAGDSLRIWMERYSKDLNVVCAFDNSEEKWGQAAYGLPVRSPLELPGLINADSRLIIASIYHEEIAKQLEEIGITDYFIFIDGMKY